MRSASPALLVERNLHQTQAIARHGYALWQVGVVASGTARELAGNAEVRAAYLVFEGLRIMTMDKSVSRPTVIFDLGGVLVGVDFMRACVRLQAAGAAPAEVVLEAIQGGTEKIGFDSGRLNPREFAARFCAAIGLRLPYSEFAEIWCDIFVEQREVTGLLDEIGKHADLVLLSNTDPLHLGYVCSHYDFLAKFGRMVLSFEVGHAKPARQMFERAIDLCAAGARMIYFDDVAEFVAAARACGLPAEQFVDAATLRCDLKRFGVL